MISRSSSSTEPAPSSRMSFSRMSRPPNRSVTSSSTFIRRSNFDASAKPVSGDNGAESSADGCCQAACSEAASAELSRHPISTLNFASAPEHNQPLAPGDQVGASPKTSVMGTSFHLCLAAVETCPTTWRNNSSTAERSLAVNSFLSASASPVKNFASASADALRHA